MGAARGASVVLGGAAKAHLLVLLLLQCRLVGGEDLAEEQSADDAEHLREPRLPRRRVAAARRILRLLGERILIVVEYRGQR